jgi:hypothetical protein
MTAAKKTHMRVRWFKTFRGKNRPHLDRLALVGAVTASVRIEVAAFFKLIEQLPGRVDRQPADAVLAAPSIGLGAMGVSRHV